MTLLDDCVAFERRKNIVMYSDTARFVNDEQTDESILNDFNGCNLLF